MLTDTTFWIDLAEEKERGIVGGARRFLAQHGASELRVSIVTFGELAVGYPTVADLQRFLLAVRVLSLPTHVAWEASRIYRELRSVGQILGENDNWIAATARSWGLRLLTRDRAFARVPRLNVITY
jgi:predicted nucleic acid-binding protein